MSSPERTARATSGAVLPPLDLGESTRDMDRLTSPTIGPREDAITSGPRRRVRVAVTEIEAISSDVQREKDFKGAFIRYEQHGSGSKSGRAREIKELGGIFRVFGVHELFDWEAYRAAAIEFVGSLFFTFAHISMTMMTADPTVKAVLTFILLFLFIYSMAPSSGGHFNPLVTMSTVAAGLTGAGRGLLYIAAQTSGAIVGAAAVWHIKSDVPSLGECDFGDAPVGSALLAESMFSFITLFFAFGIAFDPQQFPVFGPVLAPMFAALGIATNAYVSSGLIAGVGVNAARCFGPAVITGRVSRQWIYWVGELIASVVHAILYITVPPHHKSIYEQRASAASPTLTSSRAPDRATRVNIARGETGPTDNIALTALRNAAPTAASPAPRE